MAFGDLGDAPEELLRQRQEMRDGVVDSPSPMRGCTMTFEVQPWPSPAW